MSKREQPDEPPMRKGQLVKLMRMLNPKKLKLKRNSKNEETYVRP